MGSKNIKQYTKEDHIRRAGKYIIDKIKSDHRCKRHKDTDYVLVNRIRSLFLDYQCDNPMCPVRITVADENLITLRIFAPAGYTDADGVKIYTAELPIMEILREDKLKRLIED